MISHIINLQLIIKYEFLEYFGFKSSATRGSHLIILITVSIGRILKHIGLILVSCVLLCGTYRKASISQLEVRNSFCITTACQLYLQYNYTPK
jgi:hypothetical protein